MYLAWLSHKIKAFNKYYFTFIIHYIGSELILKDFKSQTDSHMCIYIVLYLFINIWVHDHVFSHPEGCEKDAYRLWQQYQEFKYVLNNGICISTCICQLRQLFIKW